ncbi:outer membrane lipoprotein-sorting protein [Akkermansiaceae bacterium]|nr:outer membrane lipoprotein-sorting protein [Akkermansiaceae bacterium]
MKAILALTLLVASSGLSSANEAETIMQSVRQVAVLQDSQDLHGAIRKGRTKTPLSMFLRGKDIQFALDGGKEYFLLTLNDGSQRLDQLIGGKRSKFPSSKIAAPIANSDVSYEDLALSFLYWPNPQIVGEDEIKGQDCWRIHVGNPGGSGRYREVSVWVTKKQRALIKVVGYGPARKSLKLFEITDLMNIKGKFTVKTMRVASFDAKGNTAGISYIDFKAPLEAKKRGR